MPRKHSTPEKLIDASVPASTPVHIRDWLKEIAGGDYASSETVQPEPKASALATRRRRPRPVAEHLGKSA
jgi:hypothetical protein